MVRKAGLMSTMGALLGNIETLAGEVNKAVEVLSTYNSNWHEARELELAKSRFERDVEWMKLGEAILSTQFNEEAVTAAKARYLNK